jgi:hypothetical protein
MTTIPEKEAATCHICKAVYPDPHGLFCSACWPDDPRRYWPGEQEASLRDLAGATLPHDLTGRRSAEIRTARQAIPIIDALHTEIADLRARVAELVKAANAVPIDYEKGGQFLIDAFDDAISRGEAILTKHRSLTA